MKIVAYNSSPRGVKSKGYNFLKKFNSIICSENKDIEFKIIQEAEISVSDSDGSIDAFLNTKNNTSDDILLLEKEFLSADIIFLVSPVYAHSVSGSMKRVIDRLAHWLHLFRLIGKRGVVISVSDNNGNDQVNMYLNEIMYYLGIYVIANISLTKRILNNNSLLDSYCSYLLMQINNTDIKNPEIPDNQEEKFKIFQNKYMNLDEMTNEKKYWIRNKYFEFNKLKDLIVYKTTNTY